MTTTGPHLRVLTAEAWSPVEPYRQRRTEAFYRWAGLECVRQGRHRVLDLGCGDGLGSAVLTAAGCRVVGVDQDNSALELARRTFRSDRLVFRAARPPQCDEPQHSFDAVVCAGLVERLADPRPLMDEALRVLRPSGLLIARTPNRLTASPGRTRPL
ncbi:MAG TPA: class I SAM-dependent methyltransferase, partial [Actinomycetota bacterium]|nr:class I SAM-dependent methyltransferase [Actinomycetota bacterium]